MSMCRKRIACVCGAGIAGSTSVRYKLEEFFDQQGITDVEIICLRFCDLEEYLDRIDLIVSASTLFKEYPVPTIVDICYLTGDNCGEANQKVLQVLQTLPDDEPKTNIFA